MKEERYYSITKYAERVGCTRNWIYKLKKRNTNPIIMVLIDKKKVVDSIQADPIVKYKPAGITTKRTYQKNGAKRKNKETTPDESELSPLTPDASTEELEKIKLYEQAKKLRIDNEIKGNLYYSKSEINENSFNLFRQLRDGAQSLKDRVAMKCRAAETDHESRKILGDEIHSILNGIVDGYDLDEETVKKKLLALLTQ